MADPALSKYHRCYISAPAGLELGVLPQLLSDRTIAWEWAKDHPSDVTDAGGAMRDADFAIVVLNGTIADYRAVFDAGVATGLGKPILLIQTYSRPLPIDLRKATTVKAGLSNSEALGFHLDMFLAVPQVPTSVGPADRPLTSLVAPNSIGKNERRPFNSDLERRAYAAVLVAGGSAVVEPQPDRDARYRPDLLAWLGNLDAELLDPVVIEVRGRVDSKSARQLEERLLRFMHSTRVRMALVLTASSPPDRDQQLSGSVLWLTIDEFEELARTGQLGHHVRESRNRILHGAR
jgi:hypothetical protein